MFEIGGNYLICLTNGWVMVGLGYRGPCGLGHKFSRMGYMVTTKNTAWTASAANKGQDPDIRWFEDDCPYVGHHILWSARWNRD